jgi:hypothetical protein
MVKLLEENAGEKFPGLGLGNDCFAYIPKE